MSLGSAANFIFLLHSIFHCIIKTIIIVCTRILAEQNSWGDLFRKSLIILGRYEFQGLNSQQDIEKFTTVSILTLHLQTEFNKWPQSYTGFWNRKSFPLILFTVFLCLLFYSPISPKGLLFRGAVWITEVANDFIKVLYKPLQCKHHILWPVWFLCMLFQVYQHILEN